MTSEYYDVADLSSLAALLLTFPHSHKIYLFPALGAAIEYELLKKKSGGGPHSYYLCDFKLNTVVGELFKSIEQDTKCEIVYNDNDHVGGGYVQLHEPKSQTTTEVPTPIHIESTPLSLRSAEVHNATVNGLIKTVSEMQQGLNKLQTDFNHVMTMLNTLKQ